MTTHRDVVALTTADTPRAAEVLADAFMDDPFAAWLFPGEDRRARLVTTWASQLRVISVPRGHAFTTPGVEGVAMWAPPGVTSPGVIQQLRMAIPFVRILGRRIGQANAGYQVIRRARPDEPHWYLSTLGVDPAHQRTGVGRALVTPMLDRADADGLIVHLETFKPDNVAYYERFGFTVTAEDDVPDGPHMWAMARLPLAGSG